MKAIKLILLAAFVLAAAVVVGLVIARLIALFLLGVD